MKIHELKTWPEFFEDISKGRKTFELRKNDRDFKIGDTLHLKEYDPASKDYTGREAWASIKHILHHRPDAGCAATFGLQPGYVIMSLGAGR